MSEGHRRIHGSDCHDTTATPASGATTVTAETSFGQASAAGSAATYSKGDHTHGSPTNPVSYAAPGLTLGTANATGAASTLIRTDATIAVFDATVPATQAFSDAAATGSAGVAARRDHLHGMPASPSTSFGTPGLVFTTSNAAGAASTAIRTDASIAVFDATSPTTSAVGDAAAVGTAAFAARRDHLHAREAFATNAIVLSTAAAAGAATTLIRSDATIAAFDATVPVTQAFSDAAATGAAAFAARRDHKHGMPATPSAHTHDGGGATSTLLGGVAEAGTGLPVASGVSAMALGDFASSTGVHSIVIGGGGEAQGTGHTSAAKATSDRCVVIGPNASSVVAEAVVIGRSANATTGDQGVAIGRDAAIRADGVAVGVGASGTATAVVSLGGSASCNTQYGVALGNSAVSTADSAVCLGAAAAASGAQSLALGGSRLTNGHAIASGSASVAVGSNSANAAGPTASGATAIAIGSGDGTLVGASATNTRSIAIGNGSSCTTQDGLAVGTASAATGTRGIAIGNANAGGQTDSISISSGTVAAVARGSNAVLIAGAGPSSATDQTGWIAIRGTCRATDSIAIGTSASTQSSDARSVALGASAATTKADQVMLGTSARVVTLPGGVEHRVNLQTSANYTLTATDYYVEFSTGNTARTATLPPATTANVGLTYWITKTDAGTGTVTVTADTTGTPDLINGAATQVIAGTQYHRIGIYVAAVDVWRVISGPGAP